MYPSYPRGATFVPNWRMPLYTASRGQARVGMSGRRRRKELRLVYGIRVGTMCSFVRAPRVSRSPAWLAGLLHVLSACADPRFGDTDAGGAGQLGNGQDAQQGLPCDAGSCPDSPNGGPDADGPDADGPDADGPDADSPADASDDGAALTGDPVRDTWIGRYAVRSAMYSVDGFLHSVAEMLSLVQIKASGAGLVLEEQLCKFEGGWNTVLVEGYVRYEFPPVKSTATMSYTSEGFGSATNIFAYGYAEPPAACLGAATLAVDPAPPWWTGDCSCTQESGPPTDLSDCRITDPEPDSHPGITLDALVNGTVWPYYGVQQQRVRYLNGYRQGNRLYASQEARDTTHIFECPGAPAGCLVGAAVACPPRYNTSEFAPIAGNYDCQRLVLEESGLFPTPIAPFPAACPNDLP